MTKTTKSTKTVAAPVVNFAARARKIAASRAANAKQGLSERDKRAIAKWDRAFLSAAAGL